MNPCSNANANAIILCHAVSETDIDRINTNSLPMNVSSVPTVVELSPPLTFDRFTSTVASAIKQHQGNFDRSSSTLTPHLSYCDSEGDVITVSSECEFNEMLRLRQHASESNAIGVSLSEEDQDADCVMVDNSHLSSNDDDNYNIVNTGTNNLGAPNAPLSLWLILDEGMQPPLVDESEMAVLPSETSTIGSSDQATQFKIECLSSTAENTSTFLHPSHVNSTDDDLDRPDSQFLSVSVAGEWPWKQFLNQARQGLQFMSDIDMGNLPAIRLKSLQIKWTLVSLLSVVLLLLMLLLFLSIGFTLSSSSSVAMMDASSSNSIESSWFISQLQDEIQFLKDQVFQRDAALVQHEQSADLQISSCSTGISQFWQPLKEYVHFGWFDYWSLSEQLLTSVRSTRYGVEEFFTASGTKFIEHVNAAQDKASEFINTVADSIIHTRELVQNMDLILGFQLPVTIVSDWWQSLEKLAVSDEILQSLDSVWKYSSCVLHVSQQQDIDVGFVIIDRLLKLWNTPIFVSDSE